MGVEVPRSLRASARELDDCESVGRKHSPHEHAAEVAAALPSSDSAGVAKLLKEAWRKRFKSWADDVHSQASGMRTAADDWDSADQKATDAARKARGLPPGG